MNLVIQFWLKSGKVRELESQKVRESQGTLLKKLEGNSEEVSHNFCRIHSVKSLFCKTLEGGGGGGSEKYMYPQTPLEFFWYTPYLGKDAGSALHVLHQAIKIRVT